MYKSAKGRPRKGQRAYVLCKARLDKRRNKKTGLRLEENGGEGGIRTLDSCLGYNRLAGGPIRPLWHLPTRERCPPVLSHGFFIELMTDQMAGVEGIEHPTLSGDCFQDSLLSQFAYHPFGSALAHCYRQPRTSRIIPFNQGNVNRKM